MIDPTTRIPHRPPVLVLDGLLEAGPRQASGVRTVRDDDARADGRLWEPALLEGLAQVAAALGEAPAADGPSPRAGRLLEVRELVVHRLPRTGERVDFRARLVTRVLQMSLVDVAAEVAGAVVAEGRMAFRT